jgi:enamine deaminase RidA (YjgF/YER057c/UK114 family)
MTVMRTTGDPGRSQIVEANGIIQLIGASADKTLDMKGQTERALARIDDLLTSIGSLKSKIMSIVVYIDDMSKWQEMHDAWMAWVDPSNCPARICVEVRTQDSARVVMFVTAAR